MPRVYINDANYREFQGDGTFYEWEGGVALLGGCSLAPALTYGDTAEGVKPLAESDLIPRSEWDDRIRQRDADKSWLEDIVRAPGGVPVNDQKRLNYCHGFSCAEAGMVGRLVMGLPFVMLSGTSIAGPITNWRNQGAQLDEDLAQIRDFGACDESYLPDPWSLDPESFKAGWKENALLHRTTEWDDLSIPGKMFDAVMTCCLLGKPLFAGFMWWRHAISGGYRAGKNGNRYWCRWRNNWGPSFGDDGFTDMEEGKGTPDLGAYAFRQFTPSEV